MKELVLFATGLLSYGAAYFIAWLGLMGAWPDENRWIMAILFFMMNGRLCWAREDKA